MASSTNRRIPLIGTVPALLAFLTVEGHATTHRVPQAYPTIAQANVVASAGDTILIAMGIHTEPDWVRLKSGLRLLGDGGMTQVTLSIPLLEVGPLPPGDSLATVVQGLTIVGDGIQITYNPLTIVRWNSIPVSDGVAIAGHGPYTLEHNLIGTGLGCNISIGDWNPTGEHDRSALTIAYNTILTRWRGDGIAIEDGLIGPGSTIHHNTFLVASPDWSEASFVLEGGTFVDLRLSSNIFWGLWADCGSGATAEWQYNCFMPWLSEPSGLCVPDETNLFDVDPEFCSPWDEDWRLGPSSPCIGAGEGGTNIGALGVGCLLDVGDPASGPEIREFRVTPTPLGARARIALSLDRSGPVSLVLYDVRGREIGTVYTGTLASGSHELPWSVPRLAPGVYLLRIEALGQSGGATRVIVEK
jgi:hypothetical protein